MIVHHKAAHGGAGFYVDVWLSGHIITDDELKGGAARCKDGEVEVCVFGHIVLMQCLGDGIGEFEFAAAGTDQLLQEIGVPVAQHLIEDGQESMAVAHMGDAFAVPIFKSFVRAGGWRWCIPLKNSDAVACAAESQG